MSGSPNIRYQYYKIKRGSAWWAKAQQENQRWRDWMANARKVARKMSKLADAERFYNEKADAVIRSCLGTHHFERWPCSMVDEVAKLTVDIQDLRESC